MPAPLLIFEDEHVDKLWPMTRARPAFSIVCGGITLADFLLDRVGQDRAHIATRVRDYLKALVQVEYPLLKFWSSVEPPYLLVNARCVPSPLLWNCLTELERDGSQAAIVDDGQLVAAFIASGSPMQIDSIQDWHASVVNLAGTKVSRRTDPLLFRYPHEIVKWHPHLLLAHLQRRIDRQDLRQVRTGLFVGEQVRLLDPLATDVSAGPIVIEHDAHVDPFVFLSGPLWIGPHCRINAHATVKQATVLGPHCRIGGEVTESIVESYSNKQHDGFLGHAYVGRWVNLGSGTTNSNMKNTYGNVRVQCGSDQVDTGMQFFGCVIGDYVRTAIQTRILTGKFVGVGAMVYGTVTRNIPDFVNFVATDRDMTEVSVTVLTQGQSRMFARRGVVQRDHHRQLLADVHALTAADRVGLPCAPPLL